MAGQRDDARVPLRSTASFHGPAASGAEGDASSLHLTQSPAYKALQEAGLIVSNYRLESASALDVVRPNSTMVRNLWTRGLAYVGGLVVGGVAYDCIVKQFSVRNGHVRLGVHQDGSYLIYGAGVHRINGTFVQLVGNDRPLTDSRIEHGNRAIVTVPQGFVGLAFDRGQPVLLSPGLHQWRSDTLKLSEFIDLSSAVIRIGPLTLLTVDEGYAAVTQDNGKQRVLPGGFTHMLTHRNWKFEKFISLKLHTDDLGPFTATTADNVVVETIAAVNWRVEDASLAARMAADTMGSGSAAGGAATAVDNPALRRDVLKQAVASLAAAIGSIRYGDDHHLSASDKLVVMDAPGASRPSVPDTAGSDEASGLAQIFSVNQMSAAVRHANEICAQYGISIVSIQVISACPQDKKLSEALSAGAVASAAAQQAEIAARGNAKAKLIASQSEAEATRINAQASADAERVRAQGKKEAAALLEGSQVAVDLARLERASELIGDKTTFFFGADPQTIPALLSNPKITQ